MILRSRAANKAAGEGVKKKHPRDRRVRAYPAPEVNAEHPLTIDVHARNLLLCFSCRLIQSIISMALVTAVSKFSGCLIVLKQRRMISHGNAKSKSEKFPPPHEDGALGFTLGASHRIDPTGVPLDIPFSSTSLSYSKELTQNWSGPLVDPGDSGAPRRKKQSKVKAREPSKFSVGTSKQWASESALAQRHFAICTCFLLKRINITFVMQFFALFGRSEGPFCCRKKKFFTG